MAKNTYNVAVVGATGVVGAEMVKVLEERSFPVDRLVPLASARSLGKSVSFRGETIPVNILGPNSFDDGVDISFFSAGKATSLLFVPHAVEAGSLVVDNTSAFRMEDGVPLVVPEVNPESIAHYRNRRIIANPNCSTIQMVVVLAPLHRQAGVKRVVVDTYQSVSGAGLAAMEELSRQSVALFSQKSCEVRAFPHRIAFNCIPHIGRFLEDGSTDEEKKMVLETPKILGDPSIRVAATAVRVPVFFGHSEALHIEFEDPMDPDQAREILADAPGVEVEDDPNLCQYPLATTVTGKDKIFVGRIRKDPTVENGLALWIAADNIRKGAALNAVQIAELWANDYANRG